MYSTCLFCHSSLGANESIEHFPIGRRLVFDAARGRLWVVCKKCERWNLSPIEERWEAIEECERLFVGTRLRVSTDNIGMTKLREGLELVRIGAPLRPEMAAWRYGDQFGRRRRQHLILSGAVVVAGVGFVTLGVTTGILAGGGWSIWNLISGARTAYDAKRVRARITLPDYDRPVPVRIGEMRRITLVQSREGWGQRVPHRMSSDQPEKLSNGRRLQASKWNAAAEKVSLITGDAALHAASKLLPALNADGAKKDEVQSAVELLGEAPDPSALFTRYAGLSDHARNAQAGAAGACTLTSRPKAARLALEMATHEQDERRAMEGELALLQEEWQRAEEIAAISDDMFVSDQTRNKLSALKKPAED